MHGSAYRGACADLLRALASSLSESGGARGPIAAL
jgi:hypothetical protein